MKSMGVATGCGFKEIYIYTLQYSEQTRVLHTCTCRRFYITGVLYILTEPEGHLVSY